LSESGISAGAHLDSCGLSLAGVEGLEPPTPGFGDRCSSQLSYTPIACSRFISPPLPVAITIISAA
jgi:hypothetical protein